MTSKTNRRAAAIAAINFEPIPAETLEKLQSISNEQWLNHLVNIRLAFAGLSKTKEELKKIARKILADDKLNPVEDFQNSIEFLSAGIEFLTAAKNRLLLAGAAVVAEKARTPSKERCSSGESW
jgi:hypothetical protein